MRELFLPINGGKTAIPNGGSFVIVGANGSGKSHLGAWIENNNSNVLRISAQRALTIPDTVIIKSEEAAWSKVYYGDESNHRKGYKWGWGKETTTLVNDYDSVLTCIFARQNKENGAYVKECKAKQALGEPKPDVPQMIIDKIYNIWNSVFPHRSIILEDSRVMAKLNNISTYEAKHMSDGERVAIYLIGQCLIAPTDTFIVIDEPEIHLHKSIMHKLWDCIEQECIGKTFVYITHDLDFASSRKDAKKIWIKAYNGNNWDMSILDDENDIPDALFFEVLGGRKPVLLVEGDKGSYDSQLYPYIYTSFSVIPCHNCSKVIELTKAFRNERVKSLHTNIVFGLIDHDYLTELEVESYKADNIYTLEVAEIENLYLVEGVVKIIAKHLGFDPDEKFSEIKDFLFSSFQKDYDYQLSSMCTKEIRHKLNCFVKPHDNTQEALKNQMANLIGTIDVDAIYNARKDEIDSIVSSHNYEGLLKIYNQKGLHSRVSQILGLDKGKYSQLVLRMLKTEQKDSIIEAMKQFVPSISL